MIGSIVLSLALASSIIAMVMYFLTFKGYQNTLNIGRIAYHIMAMLVIAASAILLYLILTHDYSYKYIYSYSSSDLPKGILAATFWAGQEGSFMLWVLLTSIVGIVLQSYSSKRGDLEPRVMAVFTLSTTFLLVMVSPLFKNPFAYIWAEPIFIGAKDINSAFFNQPWIQNFLFNDSSTGQNFVKMDSQLYAALSSAGIAVKDFIIDGKGLNPQLLNFWMQIHPPILFIGFSMATVPFAFAVAALMKNDYTQWVKQALPWVLSGAGILGLGIMMGGYWAYEMLGWGGYWAWDPVENSSLIPWLVGVASIHTLLVQRKTQAKGGIGKYAKTNLILSILTYVLVLYSTFLTRSGVLGDASVHSFVDPGMLVYLFLIIFIGTFILLGFGMIVYRWKFLSEKIEADEALLSRDLALFTAAIVLCASALIVLVGTSAPLFGSSVDTFFYNEMHVPIAIIIGLLNGLSLLLKWKQSDGKDLLKKSYLSIVLSLIITLSIIIFGGVDDVMMILLTLSSAFALIVNLEIAVKIVRGNMKMLGAYVSHIGIALFILGVIGSAAYSKEESVDLIRNQPIETLGYQLTFTGYTPIENNTKYAFNINLRRGNSTYTISPVMYISEFNNGLMREPAILNLWTKDFYISPLGYEEGKASGHNHGQVIELDKGGSTEYSGAKISFDRFDMPAETMQAMQEGKDFQMGAVLSIEFKGKKESFELLRKNVSGQVQFTDYTSKEAGLKIQLENLTAGKIQISVTNLDGSPESAAQEGTKEVLSISASTKPYINFVWTGVVIMVVGFFIAVSRRLKESLVK
ncbi:MAG: cytochrome c biogenesis protein CcsA [Ignavibacteriaceae bacterium]|nr:cytochrome c biogenesis protein CcsA [Ignavibacteriaceae bacterium]